MDRNIIPAHTRYADQEAPELPPPSLDAEAEAPPVPERNEAVP